MSCLPPTCEKEGGHESVTVHLTQTDRSTDRTMTGLMNRADARRRGAVVRGVVLGAVVVPACVWVLTWLGMALGWYDVAAQGSLFTLMMAALVLGATWCTVRRSDRQERHTKAAMQALESTNMEIAGLYRTLVQLDERKTQFFANVSHELRTPLTLILGPVEKHLRAAQTLPPDLRRDLVVVARNARMILWHINDLLDVAKLDAARVTPAYATVDAAGLVRSAADHFSSLAAERDVAFIVDAPNALDVQTDASLLQRVVFNLLSNAFKFTPRGGRVRISVSGRDGRLWIAVADSGPGIPPDQRDVVFERFQQANAAGGRPCGGSGLGLSIVRDFVVLLRGSVSAGDAPEGGALMTLDIPSVAPTSAAASPDNRSMNGRTGVQQVDDERRTSPDAPAASADGSRVLVEANRDTNRVIARRERRTPVAYWRNAESVRAQAAHNESGPRADGRDAT